MRVVLPLLLCAAMLGSVGGWTVGGTLCTYVSNYFCQHPPAQHHQTRVQPHAHVQPHPHSHSPVGQFPAASSIHIPGLPSHLTCDPRKLHGDHCCNPLLYNVMSAAFSWVKYRPDFLQAGAKKLAFAARLLVRLVQSKIGQSFEVIISEREFMSKNNHHGNFTCKFGVDGFHVLAYASPRQYNVHDAAREAKFADLDAREPLGISGNNPQLKAFLDLALRLIPVAK